MPRRGGAPSPPASQPGPSGGRQGSPPTVRVVICSDGKRGHENQSRVLARMLGDTEPLIMRLRNPEGGWGETLLRAAFAVRGRWKMPKRSAGERVRELLRPESPAAFREFTQQVGKHRERYRIFTVSTGTPPATGNLLLAALLDAEPVCVMTPSLLPRMLFKLMIVPEHDVNSKMRELSNVVVHPFALSYFDQTAAHLLASSLLPEDKRQRAIGVAVGRRDDWDDEYDWLSELARLALDHGYRLLFTNSRRTQKDFQELLGEVMEGTPELIVTFVDAHSDPVNPLPAFFENCERVVITADSFSMVSEAIQAGHQPVLRKGPAKKKVKKALAGLTEKGYAVSFHPSGKWVNTRGRIFEPNQFYNELRAEVRSRLGLD